MSRIFTFDEIRFNHLPTPDDFAEVLKLLNHRLPAVPGFVGAVIFGSALTRSFRVTSDIDVFVVFDDDSLRVSTRAQVVLSQLSGIAAQCNVPIDWLPNTKKQLEEDCHTIRAGGLDHIMWGAEHGGVIGQNPCPFVTHSGQRKREARDYVIMALDKLIRAKARWSTLAESERNKVRAKALDRPVAAARRLLEIHDRRICSWNSRQVIDALDNPTLTRLGSYGSGYLRTVEHQVANPDERRYRDYLNTVLDGHVLALAHDFFAKLLETELR